MPAPNRQEVPIMLPKIGVGHLVGVKETKRSDKGWVMSQLIIEGINGSPSGMKFIMFLPDFFHSQWQSEEYRKKFYAEFKQFSPVIYPNNIRSYDKSRTCSILEGICGETAGPTLDKLWDELNRISEIEWDEAKWPDQYMEECTQVFRNHVEANTALQIGFIAKQAVIDGTRTLNFNIDSLWIVNEANMKYFMAEAEKGKYEIAWNSEIPF